MRIRNQMMVKKKELSMKAEEEQFFVDGDLSKKKDES